MSSSSIWDNLFDDDDDEHRFGGEDEREPPWMTKDAVVLLIDARAPMFVPSANGEVPFENAVKSAHLFYQDKIICSDWDLIGWVIYGTGVASNPNDFPGICVLRNLEAPDAPGIQQLEELLEANIAEKYGQIGDDFAFCDALWTCSTMFSQCSQKVGTKRIFIFTNDDNPNGNNEQLRNQSLQRARDLADLGIDIELFALPRGTEPFDPLKFFREIINIDVDDDTGQWYYDAAEKFAELKMRIRRKEFKKRSLGRLSLKLDGDEPRDDSVPSLEIGFRLYNLIQETKKGNYTPLDAKANEPLKRVTKYVCADTGAILMDYQIQAAYDYGGRRVIFEREELQKMRILYNPGLTLIGFRSSKAVKEYHHLKHSSFLYPDESFIQGSTVAVAALLDRMLAMDKVALCRITPRSNSSPHLCYLLPQKEIVDKDGFAVQPSGFAIIFIPFAEDIRRVLLEPQPKANRDQIRSAKKLVKAININFDSRNYQNPALQKHYANLLAIATDRPGEEVIEDTTVPDVKGMVQFDEVAEEFRKSVLPDGYAVDPKKTPRKGVTPRSPAKKRARADNDEEEERPRKRARHDSTEPRDWAYLAAEGKLSSLTVADLKVYCSEHGMRNVSRLSKGELVQAITKHIEQSDAS